MFAFIRYEEANILNGNMLFDKRLFKILNNARNMKTEHRFQFVSMFIFKFSEYLISATKANVNSNQFYIIY